MLIHCCHLKLPSILFTAMPRRSLPSLTALQCFEAVARYLSVTRAAQEMHMTQSAVSKQLMQLEETLQNPLFSRVRKRLHLTPAGELYLAEVRKILNQVEASSRYVQAYGGGTEVLRVACPSTFAARWLIPKLVGFGHRYPNIHLDIRDELGPYEQLNQHADVAIYFGSGTRPYAECLALFSEDVVAVCAPPPLHPDKPHSLQGLAHMRLLQQSSRPQAWHEWFEAQGLHNMRCHHGPRFISFHMTICAAQAGCGLALVPRFLIKEELADGKLVLAWPYAHRSVGAYHLAYAERAASVPKIQAFTQWVTEQLEQEPRRDAAA